MFRVNFVPIPHYHVSVSLHHHVAFVLNHYMNMIVTMFTATTDRNEELRDL